MSSHREAPEIAKDPVADGTDVYAFRHPTRDNSVVLIANFIPLQQPNGGPNFYEFADDVLYEIKVSNTKSLVADVTYQFRFTTRVRNPSSFLYNTGPITSIGDETWNRPQTYSVTRVANGRSRILGTGIPVPPVNVGPRSTPNYPALAEQARFKLPGNRNVFAGQRADAFHVDLGSVFDLGGLRPFNEAHVIDLPTMGGVNAVQSYNVHTIALVVPSGDLTRDGEPYNSGVRGRRNVIGVWATASRQSGRVWNASQGRYIGRGPWVQVSRLGNPLFNEVLVPMGLKDRWNASEPTDDAEYAQFVARPELARLLPGLYPGVFPNLEGYNSDRADLDAILLTGIPLGVVPGFQNFTGPRKADVLRLNMAIDPTPTAEQSPFGLLGGDLDGFPNGRRLGDDIVAIELRAIAGVTIPLVDDSYTPDAAAGLLTDGTTNTNSAISDELPFLGDPGGGYQTVPGTTSATGTGDGTGTGNVTG